MGGIYIPGMEMPTSCIACMFDEFGLCLINKNLEAEDELAHSCPIVPVPPHGRLVDADALFKKAHYRMGIMPGGIDEVEAFIRAIDLLDAPTIIPADKNSADLSR